MPPTTRSSARNLGQWTAAQFAAASVGLLLAGGGGILLRVWRRSFRWRAASFAAVVQIIGFGALALHIAHLDAAGVSIGPSPLWGASLGVAALSGAAAASVSGALAFWELQALVAVTTAAVWACLRDSGAGQHDPWALAHGARLFGSLWDRMLGLWAPLAFLAAVIGASLALAVRGIGEARAPGSGRGTGFALAWRLARRHLAGRQRFGLSSTAVVAVLGIGLGVAALLATTAVMSGYQEDIRSRILGTNAHLVVQKYGLDFTGYAEIVQAAEVVPGVLGAAPFAFNEAMLAGTAQGSGVLLKGIDPARAARVTDVGRNLCLQVVGTGAAARCIHAGQVAGAPEADAAAGEGDNGAARLQRLLAAGDGPPPLLVGLSLYQRLGLPIGSPVRLMTPVGMAGSRGNAPRRAPFILAGVFSSGMHEFDSRLIYTSLAASQHLLGMGEAVSGVELRLRDPYAVEAVGREVLERIGRYPFRTLDWRQLNAGIFTALTLQKVVMFLVLAFIVVVASFNVASTLFMAVAQKAEQVRVLKAMGAKDGTILQTFLLEGWFTGVMGCALGLGLGLFATWALGRMQLHLAADVYMVSAVRVRLDPTEVGLVILSTLSICHLAALVPALGAATDRRVREQSSAHR